MTELKTTYKEQLEIAKSNNINIVALLVAYEVHCTFDWLNEVEFEETCKLIKTAYLKSDNIDIWKLCHALYNLCCEVDFEETLEIIKNTSVSSLIDEAYYF